MSIELSSLQGKKEPEEIEMSAVERKNSTASVDKQETSSEDQTTEVKSHKAEDNDGYKASEKRIDDHVDNAEKGKYDQIDNVEKGKDDQVDNGENPFSAESFGPLMSGNQYSLRKTASQALMDVALMMANISQLRTLLNGGEKMEYYVILLVLVILSLAFQLIFAVLMLLIWTRESEQHQKDEYQKTLREVLENTKTAKPTGYDITRDSIARRKMSYQGHRITSHLNYVTMVLVFVIIVINMFITGFGIKLEASTDTIQKTTNVSS